MQLRKALCVGAALATASAMLMIPTAAQAKPTKPEKGRTGADTRTIPPGKQYALDADYQRTKGSSKARTGKRSLSTQRATAPGTTPPVGTVSGWLALDDEEGTLYLKEYTLRGVGDHIEVWVANDLAFPAGDCRASTPGSTEVTNAQVASLVREFDTNMYPKESAAFSTPPSRDGSDAYPGLAQALGYTGPTDFGGAGNRIVTLVDNVRDSNFYEFPENPTYIAGFHSSQFNELLDRNVMTIDAFDWLHRTGANPADQPTNDLCTSRPARPRLYEGTFAHEYQHLLQYYQDPNEVNFINEGLSDFAISLTGYGNSLASVQERGAESHLYCFQGFGTVQTPYNTNPRDCGGPQNSLTLWGDEGDGNEILADYGNAWSFQLFLFDRYGQAFITALHRDAAHQGLDGVQAQLDRFARGTKVMDVLHDFQTMNLVDRYLGDGKGNVVGAKKASAVTTPSLRATVNLDNPASYIKPGAAPNGADYVRLRDAKGRAVDGKALQSLSFTGDRTLAPQPLLWTSVTNAPGRTGNPTLFSGNSNNLDVAAIAQVAVPTSNPVLTFTERHGIEAGYDYGYVIVSTDGGRTYTALPNANTEPGPFGPALQGTTTSFGTQTYDLAPYAGRTVLLGFRYTSDGGVNEGGWYVDDVKVGNTLISDGTLTGFRSLTQVRPTEVANWNVRLVGLDPAKGKARIEEFTGTYGFTLSKGQLANFSSFPQVVAIVAYDEPTEQVQQYAPYRLVVNGVTQPGGGK